MFFVFQCIDIDAGRNTSTEICSFYGIRYNVNGFAVISTEHRNHDYLLPMKLTQYESLASQLTESLKNGKNLVRLTQGSVYRVRRGAIIPMDNKGSGTYSLES